jgi:hypothetical protein
MWLPVAQFPPPVGRPVLLTLESAGKRTLAVGERRPDGSLTIAWFAGKKLGTAVAWRDLPGPAP